jgi:Fe-S cluster biogenesis protein NfuA
MPNTNDGLDIRSRMQRLDGLIEEVERFTDPVARVHTQEVIQTILEIHGAGLEKVLEHLAGAGETGQACIAALAEDELVRGLLLLYGLHPLDLETRLGRALERVRPYLASHGGKVELLGVVDGVVRLRMQGSCQSCPSSALTLQGTIEEAIYAEAPDVTGIEVEGLEATPAQTAVTFVPVDQLLGSITGKRRRENNGEATTTPAGACSGHQQG